MRCDAAEEQASQLQTSLRSLKRDMQARVSELEQELRLVKEASEMALSDYERKQGREMRELKEQLQAGDSELLAMRGNILELSRALEERKREVDGCRESLREASEREARLQMDLIACQQQQQQQGKAPPPVVPSSGHGEQLVTKLMEQRDAAKAALEEAQSRLLDKETEIGQLRDVLAQLSPRRIGGVPSVLAAVAGASKPSSSHLKPRDRFRGLSVQLPHPFPGNSSSPASVPPLALESSVDSLPDLSSLQQAFMALVPSPTTSTVAPARSRPQPPGGSGAHNPVDGSSRYPGSLPEHNLPLSSEEDETMIPSPSSSSPNVNFEPKSFRQHFASDGIHPVGPRGDLEVLLRPFAESLLQQFQAQAQNGQELDHLREAARQLGEENIRLKSTLAIMRNEMEALSGQRQQQQQGPEEGDEHSLRHSISLLRAELEESDKDVLQAMQHVHVLQRQLSAVALHNNSSEESTSAGIRQQDDLTLAAGGETELSFLRTRAHDLSMENRSLRRRLLQSRLLPPPGNLPNESRERDRPENDDLSPVPSFVMTRPSPLPVGSVEGGDLDAELDEARQTVARVSAENGRLMELSNSLRAERDRLLHLVSALTARELSAGESDEFESEIEEVTLKANLSRPRPHVAHLSQSSLAISNQDQPETSDSVSFLPQPNQDSPPPHSPDAPFSFQSLEPSQLFTPLPTSQHTKSKSLPSASSKEPRDPIAALNAVAIARAQHHRQQSAASDEGSITNQVNLHIGAISPSSRLPSAVPGSASSRETASQRSKLLALQRRKEVEARQVELDEMRPQVRNYNIKDNVE